MDELIAERKQNGDHGEDDLLSHMLKGVDPETGASLDDENIRFQIITFLIAKYENDERSPLYRSPSISHE